MTDETPSPPQTAPCGCQMIEQTRGVWVTKHVITCKEAARRPRFGEPGGWRNIDLGETDDR